MHIAYVQNNTKTCTLYNVHSPSFTRVAMRPLAKYLQSKPNNLRWSPVFPNLYPPIIRFVVNKNVSKYP